MKLKIKANTFAMQRYLQVDAGSVTFCETALTGGKRTFSFQEVESVIISTDNLLAFQVGQEVFSLPVKPSNKKHQQVIDALLQGVGRTT